MKLKKITAIAALSLSSLPAFAGQFTLAEQSAYCSGLMANAYNITKNSVFQEAGTGFIEVVRSELQNNRITEERLTFILQGTMNQAADRSKENLVLDATKDCVAAAVKAGFVK